MQRDKGIIIGVLAAFLVLAFVLLNFNVIGSDRDAPIEAETEEVADTDTADDQSDDSADENSDEEDAPETPEPEPGSDDLEDTESKPNVPAQEGDAPAELETEDIVVGDGKEAKDGDTVVMDYVGVLYDDGTEFDSSWDRDQPCEFTIGEGMVIEGWDKGIPGMKVGGRRILRIPAEQAYGEAGSPPTIPENAALVFIVDLREIK